MLLNQHALGDRAMAFIAIRRFTLDWTKTLLIMQLIAILLLACSLTLSARTASQTISFSGKNVLLEKAFRAIKEQTSFVVISNADQISQAKPITIHAVKLELKEFLELILKDQPFTYTIEDKTISIKKER